MEFATWFTCRLPLMRVSDRVDIVLLSYKRPSQAKMRVSTNKIATAKPAKPAPKKSGTSRASGRETAVHSMTTKERILLAAKHLFSSRAYADVRISDIAKASKSNIALVNYYFGSKENLFGEIFRAECDAVAIGRIKLLDQALQNTPVTLESLLHAWLDPVFDSVEVGNNRILFTHLMTLVLWSEVNDQVLSTINNTLRLSDSMIANAIHRVRPDLSQKTIGWRMFSGLGTYSLVLGHPELVEHLRGGKVCNHADFREVRAQIFSFLLGGLSAPEVA
ncbi:TetR/AcrR family transcriptional regulator [Sphingobium sp. HBC34]|uniref:TetR/AcrR family transcriptional regulator n=1 Tax=Sphingobium cyanobacteriorum TaxID=3063954 RepID=A0ABT8ZS52_9SPHN|nr:TetR/AcrR family transcriptional regulator [Sphingobium sp. HBC34]MDO7837318.1 TetR/AcrR family transcriptional regulator [Sphingobium sp. HBC34]